MELLKEVLKQIKPTPEEEKEVAKKIELLLKKINPNLNNAEAVLGGSGAKRTWLAGAHDVDIYVCFSYERYREKSAQLADLLEKVLKKLFPALTRLHGSRDYFQIKENKFTFEIIPILKIEKAEQALNITDISPLHVKWVKSHPEYADEIRLTKQFCKANSVYGAESYIRGFSGYDCEVLAIYFKGFLQLAEMASEWSEKVILDPENYYKSAEEVIQNLNVSKIVSPLIIVDPVQKERNVAAALSEEKFELFKHACRKFIEKPSADFFRMKETTIEHIKQKAEGNKLIIMEITSLKGKEDVIGSKLLKVQEYITSQMQSNDFKVIEKGWTWDKESKAVFWYILDKKLLKPYKKWMGPPIKAAAYVKEFKKAHKGEKVYTEKNRVCADIKRKFTEPELFIKKLIKEKYIKERVKEINLI